MKKSICIVSSQYLPHIGGVENYIDNLSKELVRQGNEVTIVTSYIEGTKKYEKKNGIEIFRMPTIQFMNGRFPVKKYNMVSRKLTKTLKSRKFDVMLVNMRFYVLSLYAVRLAKKMNIRCIMLDHGTSHLNTGGKFTSKLGEIFEHTITWMEKRYCKEFAGVSYATLDWVKHFGINSDKVLYNSIDVDEFEKIKEKEGRNFRKEYGIPQDATVISFVGRITVEKGIEELAKAVDMITKKRDDVWLLAAGSGYLEDKINSMANDKIHLVGNLSKEDVVAMLKQSNIFCLPSVSEGFPTTVLEAAVCGNYIISTYRGGTKELIKNRDYGIILEDNEPQKIYNAIMEIIDKKMDMEKSVKMCYKSIVDNYTWKQTAKKFLDWLDD
jgi:glycosyltransferase involved in cell wall biosynthesis